MAFDVEKALAEISVVFNHEAHERFINTRLPNKGDDVDTICKEGLEQFRRNFGSLYDELTVDMDKSEDG